MFGACEICGADDWSEVYAGPVRDGAFGSLTDDGARVARCGGCGTARLAERHCREESIYETERYRELLAERPDSADFFARHDVLQPERLEQFPLHALRDRVIADVGCGAGSFLDHVAGLPRRAIAVEPCKNYHDRLTAKGYRTYPYASDALVEEAGEVDFAFSFSVIEHVADPRAFLADIRGLLRPEGRLLVSTPNRDDLLLQVLPDAYPPFFYRTVHRWYFDVPSLTECARRAGFEPVEARCAQRFGLSNFLLWLRDRRPSGHDPLPHLERPILDRFWKEYLAQEGVGDYLYLTFAPAR